MAANQNHREIGLAYEIIKKIHNITDEKFSVGLTSHLLALPSHTSPLLG